MVVYNISTLLTILLFLFQPISCLEFVYRCFNKSSLLLYGDATTEQYFGYLTLTSGENSVSRALHPQPIPTRSPNSSRILPFFTSFVISISSYRTSREHSFTFISTPFPGFNDTRSDSNSGLPNYNNSKSSTPFFAVHFVVKSSFNNSGDTMVSILMNSLHPKAQHEAGIWHDDVDTKFQGLELSKGGEYQVWIDYMNSHVNVSMGYKYGKRPNRPLLTTSINLSEALLDQMYVGFSASNEKMIGNQGILSWSFSNSNSSIGDSLDTRYFYSNSPFETIDSSVNHSKWFILGVSLGGVLVIMCVCVTCVFWVKKRSNRVRIEKLEDWELEYWPHRINYQVIHKATKGFSEKNVIGHGGNGKVYKGLLQGGIAVAIKRISLESAHGMKEFLAEVSSLGRLRHKNLVGLRGWSKTQTRGLMLVYDYMDCGSLDKWLFKTEENQMLDWHQRIKILMDVASGIAYLHEGWEARVVHGDIKASNILLDKDLNARLGDFGLARVHFNEQSGDTTRVIGTVGYMAPELLRNGRASALTDVFSFGIVILEVVCGRRSIEEGKQNLTDWVKHLMQEKKLVDAIDESLKENGKFCEDEEVEKVLQLGFRCAYPEPNARPSMRQILKALRGPSEEATLRDDDVYINSTQDMVSTEISLLSSCVSLSLSDAILEGR